MESAIVIKVKFGETLRRFNARIVDSELDLDMAGMREKILKLFNFAADADLTLTYIDEDGDVVTLADEDDLCDTIRQSLNPLRITVRLNTEKSGRSYARSSGSSTPLRSSQNLHPFQNLNASVSEIFKSVPEPLRDAFSKLSNDLASKATSTAPGHLDTSVSELFKSVPEPFRDAFSKLSADLASISTAPGLAELVDSSSRTGLHYLSQAVPESGASSGAAGSSCMGTSDDKDQQASKVDGPSVAKSPVTKSEAPIVEENKVFSDAMLAESIPKSNEPVVQKLTEGLEASGVQAAGSVKSNMYPAPKMFGSSLWKPIGHSFVDVTQPPSDGSAVEKKKDASKSESSVQIGWSPSGFGASNPDYLKQNLQDSQATEVGGKVWPNASNCGSRSSGWHHGQLNPIGECPFSGMPLGNDSLMPPLPFAPRVSPFKRSYNHGNRGDGIGSIFHRGVRCDGCGVHPITGPRFKSKVKEDYDLCSICFEGMGNEADYIRMDRPAVPRLPLSFKGIYDPSRMRHPTMIQVPRGSGMKPSRPKLDSRFILDVNVLDGTLMAPLTPFTKIWRMRNNGTIVWPKGSQLLWIGGDRLSSTFSIEVEIPADGLHVDKEIDIAVDFTAPERPGRYISYWRMASPSGQKFGQRVWVLMQVDASLKESREIARDYDLNFPPIGTGMTDPEIVGVKVEPLVEDSYPEPHNLSKDMELVEPIVDAYPNKDQDLNFPINDTLLVGGGAESSTPSHGTSSITYPIIDLSELPPAVSLPPQSPSTFVQTHLSEFPPALSLPLQSPSTLVHTPTGEDVNDREQSLLQELEEMGFTQIDLNKEILRMNEYDLEQAVDELCGVAEWDPILEELQEMGFVDKETNKRLLKKNNGSIKRVVMDLIAGEDA